MQSNQADSISLGYIYSAFVTAALDRKLEILEDVVKRDLLDLSALKNFLHENYFKKPDRGVLGVLLNSFLEVYFRILTNKNDLEAQNSYLDFVIDIIQMNKFNPIPNNYINSAFLLSVEKNDSEIVELLLTCMTEEQLNSNSFKQLINDLMITELWGDFFKRAIEEKQVKAIALIKERMTIQQRANFEFNYKISLDDSPSDIIDFYPFSHITKPLEIWNHNHNQEEGAP